jgi:hypothetical protein
VILWQSHRQILARHTQQARDLALRAPAARFDRRRDRRTAALHNHAALSVSW